MGVPPCPKQTKVPHDAVGAAFDAYVGRHMRPPVGFAWRTRPYRRGVMKDEMITVARAVIGPAVSNEG